MAGKGSADDKATFYVALLQRYSDSDLTIHDFCATNNVSVRTLQRWAAKLGYDLRRRTWRKGYHPESAQGLQQRQRHGVFSYAKVGLVPCDGCP